MPTIPLAKAMIVWTPNKEPFLDPRYNAAAGSIAVVEHPDDQNAWSRYPCSYGAGNIDWKQGDDNYRLQELANLIGQFANDDNMNMDHVREALRAIEGIERLSGYRPKPRV